MRLHPRYRLLIPILVLGLLAAGPVFAKRFGSFAIPENCRIAGDRVPAGDYDIAWKALGNERVEVNFYLGSRIVATAEGTLLSGQARSARHAVVLRPDGKGGMDLVEVRIGGSTRRIRLAS